MMLAKSKESEPSLLRVSLIILVLRMNLLTNILGAVAVEPIDWSKGTAAMKIFEGLEKRFAQDATHKSPADFLMVVGDGRDDEVIFRWANEISRSKKVENVTTVSLGSRNTEAGYTLTQGVTGMYISVP
jgi:trehalose-6-phosphatase